METTLITPTKAELWKKKDWLIKQAEEHSACENQLQRAIEAATPEELERVFIENIYWMIDKIINHDFPVVLSDGNAWYDTQVVGNDGIATAGYRGRAIAGHRGTATAGYRGRAIAGHRGTATAGRFGKATAGYDGMISIRYWCDKTCRVRLKTGYIGEGGLKPNTPYKLDDQHNFVEAA